MENPTIDIFLHGAGGPRVVQGRPDEILRDLLARHDALPGAGQHVFGCDR